ncbi:hypothetical protein E2C01_067111 [Portunus trituberculatus]|uniref:Uncharacterized protein n=1 Tax=Portunus trituberculatus TaxID=210409 RepID=A0A5B7HVP7_PORTR|nr:hypothetical protein [Portunus trituberculatus]
MKSISRDHRRTCHLAAPRAAWACRDEAVGRGRSPRCPSYHVTVSYLLMTSTAQGSGRGGGERGRRTVAAAMMIPGVPNHQATTCTLSTTWPAQHHTLQATPPPRGRHPHHRAPSPHQHTPPPHTHILSNSNEKFLARRSAGLTHHPCWISD